MFESYGGKRAIARRLWTPVEVVLSRRRRFIQPLDAPARRLVFVCAGNTCRSPFAEHFARTVGASSASMGLTAADGTAADPVATTHARSWGIDLRSHVARRFAVARCLPGDLVLAFELVHAERLESLLRGRGVTVRLLGAYASPFLYHQHDPYGLADTYFHHCFDGIARSIKAMIKTMPKLAAEVPKCES